MPPTRCNNTDNRVGCSPAMSEKNGPRVDRCVSHAARLTATPSVYVSHKTGPLGKPEHDGAQCGDQHAVGERRHQRAATAGFPDVRTEDQCVHGLQIRADQFRCRRSRAPGSPDSFRRLATHSSRNGSTTTLRRPGGGDRHGGAARLPKAQTGAGTWLDTNTTPSASENSTAVAMRGAVRP